MTTVYLSPIGNGTQFFDDNGVPLNGGKIYTYAAGTTTNQATYTTSAGSVQNANPVVLGSDGRPPNEIWLQAGIAYNLVLKDASGNQLDAWDNLSGINDNTALLAAVEQTVTNVAALTALAVPTSAVVYATKGYYTAGDKGAGVYLWNFADTTAANGGTVLQPDSAPATGRWNLLVFNNRVALEQFGARSFTGTNVAGATDSTTQIQACFTWCVANTCIAVGNGKYKITSALSYIGGGGIDFTNIGADYVSTNAGIVVSGTGYTALTIGSYPTAMNVGVFGTGNTANGILLQNPQIAKMGKLTADGFDGYGVKINKCYDCTIEHIAVTNCGNATEYAFSMNDDGSTCNESFIAHLQVELASQKAIFISPNTTNCTFGNIHSERATPAAGVTTWALGGQTCRYDAVRLTSLATVTNSLCYIEGADTSLKLRSEGDIPVKVNASAGTITLDTPHIEGTFSNFLNQVGGVSVLGGTVTTFGGGSGTVRLTNFVGTQITVLSPADCASDPNNLMLTNCTIGTVNCSGGTSAAAFNGGSVAACTGLPIIGSYNGVTLNNAVAIGLASRGGTFVNTTINADVALGAAGPKNLVFGSGCVVNGALSRSGANVGAIFADDFRCTSATAAYPFAAAPTGDTWRVGDRSKNLVPVVGQPTGWVCTVAGTPGTWVNLANL